MLCITVCSLDPSVVLVFIHSPVEMVMIARSDFPLVRTLSMARFWYLSSSWTSVICVGTVVIILSDTCIGVCSLPDTTQYASVIRSSNHIVTDDGAGLLNQIGAVSKAKYKSVWPTGISRFTLLNTALCLEVLVLAIKYHCSSYICTISTATPKSEVVDHRSRSCINIHSN